MTFYGIVHSNIFPANISPAEGNEALSALKGSVTQSVMSECCTIWPFCFMSLVGIRETFRSADSASYSLYFAAGGTGLSDAGARAASSPRHPTRVSAPKMSPERWLQPAGSVLAFNDQYSNCYSALALRMNLTDVFLCNDPQFILKYSKYISKCLDFNGTSTLRIIFSLVTAWTHCTRFWGMNNSQRIRQKHFT